MTAVEETIFWGSTGHARVLRETLAPTGVRLVALFDNAPEATSPFADVPIFHGSEGFRGWQKTAVGQIGFLVAVGGHRGFDRLMIHSALVEAGLIPLVAIHSSAWLAAGVTPGPGSQVLARASVAVDVEIGKQCIINTSASVDHECILSDGVHIGPGAALAGCVRLGRGSTVYTGATVVPRVHIGEGAVVGAGSVVIKDVPAWTVVVGNPARVIREIPHVED